MAASIFTCVVVTALAACSSGRQRSAGGDCALAAADSVFLTGGDVYRDCAVDRRARLSNPSVPIDFRPSSVGGNQSSMCFFAQLEFVVDASGRPEAGSARVQQSNNPDYARAVLASLPAWRYEPALIDGVPVRQIVNARRSAGIRIGGSGNTRVSRPPGCR